MDGARRQAHTIKGAAANMCTENLREIAYEMEKAGQANDPDALRAGMDRLRRAFDQVKQIMKGA